MNYGEYHFSGWEWATEGAKGMLLVCGALFLFYQNMWVAILVGVPCDWLYLKKRRKDKAADRRRRLNLDFKECVASLSTALSAGYSMENAWEEARKDLSLLYTEDVDIMVEMKGIVAKLRMNQTVEDAFMDFAVRSGVEDIVNFADVLVMAKRTGGDLVKALKRTGDVLGQKIEVGREIETMVAAKKLESRIMSVVPLAMIGYLWLFSKGYLAPLYHNLFGVLFMTGALALYVLAYCLMDRITNIPT